VWYYRISVACDTMEQQKEMWGRFEFVLLSPTLVWSTPLDLPGRCGGHMHQHSTSGIRWRRTIRMKKVTLHMLTHGAMRRSRLTSWMVCINDKFHDIRKTNVTIRSEIWTTNIRSLGFWDIRECVTLWELILRSLGCIRVRPIKRRSHLRPIYLMPPNFPRTVW
jgi:hypothetical protein